MSDPELERILQRKTQELAKPRGALPGPARIAIMTSHNFGELTNRELPLLIDFWAEWCAPCRYMHPILEKLAAKYAGRLLVGRLNVDLERELAARYHVFSIPTFILFRGGQPVDSVIGAVGERGLESLVQRHVR